MEYYFGIVIFMALCGGLDLLYCCCPPLQPYINMCCNAIGKCLEYTCGPVVKCVKDVCTSISKCVDKCCKSCFGVDVGRFPDEAVEQDAEQVAVQQNNLDPLMHHPDLVILMGDNGDVIGAEHA